MAQELATQPSSSSVELRLLHLAGASVEAAEPTINEPFEELLCKYVEVHRRLHTLQGRVQDAQHLTATGPLIANDKLASRERELQRLVDTLDIILAHKDTLLRRMQQPCVGPSIPVQQEEAVYLQKLLKFAANNPLSSHRGRLSAQWLAAGAESPLAWLQQSGGLSATGYACQDLHTGLLQLEDSLAMEGTT